MSLAQIMDLVSTRNHAIVVSCQLIRHASGDSSEQVMRAVGERELMWLQNFGKKRYPRESLDREFYGRQKIDPKVQMKNLSDYLKVVPYIIPEEEQLNLPTVRHPDLSFSNIFISESGDISGIIDWQHATILPIFLQAKIPKHFQNHGDDNSVNFRRPKLADDFDTMSDSEKQIEMGFYRRRRAHYSCLGHTSRLKKAYFHAMVKHNLVMRSQLYDTAGWPWEGDNTSLKAELIKILAHWSEIASPKDDPPMYYSPAEIEECLDRDSK